MSYDNHTFRVVFPENSCDESHNVDKVITICKYVIDASFLLDKAGIVDAVRRCVSLGIPRFIQLS